jgi:DNA-binding NtrC family response regulator
MKTILLVDDDQAILSCFEDALRAHGYNVVTKSDAESALAFVAEGNSIDLAVTDYSMPGMNGNELCAALLRSIPSLPVIILTGHGSVENYLKAVGSGVREYISKPIDPEDLHRIIEVMLRRAVG